LPIFFSHSIDQHSRLAIWHITEPEDFFLEKVPLSRSITHPHKRLQHLAGRYLLQYLFPDLPIHLIQIADTRKPYLASESHHFSISHCGDYAAAIVSTSSRVGVDIEHHSERIRRIQHKFLNDHELQLEEKLGEFFPTIIWSAKESMFKWYSLGEVDFQEHLQIREVIETNGQLVLFSDLPKMGVVRLDLQLRCFGQLICTWVKS
jgi:4'-phosphopantetheinyl transferase EntD